MRYIHSSFLPSKLVADSVHVFNKQHFLPSHFHYKHLNKVCSSRWLVLLMLAALCCADYTALADTAASEVRGDTFKVWNAETSFVSRNNQNKK